MLHDELTPYLFSTVVDAHLRGGSLLKNASLDEESHQVGDYLFTKALTAAGGHADFHLPAEGQWIDFYTGLRYEAGQKIERSYALDQFPLFVKAGAIIPMNINSDVTGIGDASMAGTKTVLIYPNGVSTRMLHLPDGEGTEYTDCLVSYDETHGRLAVKHNANDKFTFIIKGLEKVKKVRGASSWQWDAARKTLVAKGEGRDINIQILK